MDKGGVWKMVITENEEAKVILKDLFLWYENLYKLRGISLSVPSIIFENTHSAWQIRNDLFIERRKLFCFQSQCDGYMRETDLDPAKFKSGRFATISNRTVSSPLRRFSYLNATKDEWLASSIYRS